MTLVTAFAPVPTLLNLLHIPGAATWPLFQRGSRFDLSRVLLIQFRRRRSIEGRFPPWVIFVYAVSILAVAGLWPNVAGIPFSPGVGPYAIVLTWALWVFGFIFVRTIELFLHRAPPARAG